MKKNIGNSDKFIRFVIAFVTLLLYFADAINGWITAALFVLLMATALFNFCPLYRLLRINTRHTRHY